MNGGSMDLCDLLLRDIDAVYPPISQASARLTDAQVREIDRLRAEIRRLCEDGKNDDARRTAKLARDIIREGPPDPG